MNIQQMRYVTAIANNGSFREAAKKLYVSQPSLSHAIKELEQELNVQLFERTSQGAYLTKEGSDFSFSFSFISCLLGILSEKIAF